jgi:N-acylneuraminate cytidylyltransferase
MNVLAIIPARSGSKRLPGKNIKELCGKPLISWTIEAALSEPTLNEVIVSTDCENIAKISVNCGAKVPYLRPKSLAADESTTVDVIRSIIEYYSNIGKTFDFVMLLQPTSPLRTSKHISEAISLLKEKDADSVISVCPVEHSPLWSNTLDESLSMDKFIDDDIKNSRSQDLPKYYRLNGALYLTRVSRFLVEGALLLSSNSYAYVMDSKSSIDIDEELDFLFAETILNKRDT